MVVSSIAVVGSMIGIIVGGIVVGSIVVGGIAIVGSMIAIVGSTVVGMVTIIVDSIVVESSMTAVVGCIVIVGSTACIVLIACMSWRMSWSLGLSVEIGSGALTEVCLGIALVDTCIPAP